MRYLLVAVGVLYCLQASAEPRVSTMQPTKQERLPVALKLKDCSGVQIIEWRPAPGFTHTGPSDEALAVINQTCKLARSNFGKFLQGENITLKDPRPFAQSLCLIPARLDRSGDEPRNLNDAFFRFSERKKTYNPDGSLPILWGYTQHRTHTVYIRNDVLNDDGTVNHRFVTIFAHELYHAMSWHSGVYASYSEANKSAKDERLARAFTRYLNLGE